MNPVEPIPGSPAPAAPPAAPALWNPNAAGLWSILFSPVFGGWLHGKNWLALGEPDKARLSRQWAYGTIAVVVIISLLTTIYPEMTWLDTLTRPLGLALLVAWWLSIGREQKQLVETRYGKSYPRRSFWGPLGYALLIIIAFILLVVALAFVFGVADVVSAPSSGRGKGPVL